MISVSNIVPAGVSESSAAPIIHFFRCANNSLVLQLAPIMSCRTSRTVLAAHENICLIPTAFPCIQIQRCGVLTGPTSEVVGRRVHDFTVRRVSSIGMIAHRTTTLLPHTNQASLMSEFDC